MMRIWVCFFMVAMLLPQMVYALNHSVSTPSSAVSAHRSVSESFSAGVQALVEAKSESDYQVALGHFLAALEKGIVHEDLYYNLGNTYYHLNQLGNAVYYFEKALQVHPKHEAARYNLALTQQLIAQKYKDEIVHMGQESTWTRLVTLFSASTLTWVFLLLWWVFFGVLIALFFVRAPIARLVLVTAAVIVGLAVGIFGTLFIGREVHDRTTHPAIVLSDELTVREAPQESANPAFVLHAGSRVQVGTSDRHWIKIRLPNGMEGWVERRYIGIL